MTISAALKVHRGIAILSAVAVVAVVIIRTPVEAAPVVRDHRTAPAWQPDLGKNKKATPEVRDNRNVPTWNPIRQPYYPKRPSHP